MTNWTVKLFGAAALIGLVAGVPSTASAQARQRDRGDRGYAANAYSKADVDRVIRRAEDRSDAFQRTVDSRLDHSRLNGSRAEDRINAQVKQLEKALDQLRSEFNRRSNWGDTRSNVERVIRESDQVNQIVRRSSFGPVIEREWSQLRNDLNTLASVYNLRPVRS